MDCENMEMKNSPKYSVGTLSYTGRGIVLLFFWMLWGWFCFTIMEGLIPNFLPITFKSLGVSNTFIGIVVGTIPAIMNIFIVPVISLRSDRHRGPLGRRIPFMLYSTPFLAIFLILVGWGPELGRWIHGHLLGGPGWITPYYLIIGIVVIGAVLFQLFYLFVAAVYYYLFADVVPEILMGRFMGLLNMVAAGAGFIFSRYIYIHAETHAGWIYTLVSVIYCVAMILVCFNVKEGQYPPAEAEENPGLVKLVKTYWNECYTKPYYLLFFIGTAMSAVSLVCRTMFTVFFARQNMNMSMEEFGKLLGWFAILNTVLAFPCGYLVDKIKPIRAYNIGLLTVILCSTLSFFFISDKSAFIVFTLMTTISYSFQKASNLPMFVELLPKDRYGQFCAAQALINSLALVLANTGGGIFIDIMGDYRYLYMWDAIFTAISLAVMLQVYKRWKQYGGGKNYIAP